MYSITDFNCSTHRHSDEWAAGKIRTAGHCYPATSDVTGMESALLSLPAKAEAGWAEDYTHISTTSYGDPKSVF